MKRFVAGLLAALLLLTFAGCADQKTGEYDHIVQLLEQGEYDAAKKAIDRLPGNTAVEPSAAETQACEEPAEEELVEEVPAEETTEATAAAPAYESRKVLVNMVNTTVDNLGNKSTSKYYTYEYDPYGRVINIGGHESAMSYGVYLFTFADHLAITYASDGTIENVKVVDSANNVSALGTPSFSENGNMISMHIQTNSEEYTLNFAYDANGNRVRADIYTSFWEEIAFDVQYSYDTEGRLIKEVWDVVGFGVDGRTIEYTYDESGVLVESCTTWHGNKPWQENTVYTYDNDGDMLQSVTTTDNKESGYQTKTRDYKYEHIRVSPLEN